MENEYDVIIVGGGIAGLGSAGLLSKAGNKVLVLEKRRTVGGRAASFQTNGVIRSWGQHVVIKDLKFEELLRRLEIKDPKKAFFEDIFLTFEGELRNLDEILPLLAARAPDDFKKMGKLLGNDVDLEELDDLSADEWLKDYVTNPLLLDVFQLSGAILSTIPRLEEMPASVLYETIQLALHHRQIWIAAKGMQEIFNSVVQKIKQTGGTVLTGVQVQSILIEHNRVCGVRAKNKKDEETREFTASNVVLAAPSWDLIPIILQGNFPANFVDKLHYLSVRTANIGLTALLPEPVYIGKRFFMVNFPTINYPGSILMLTNIAPSLAPRGKHLFDVTIICNYDEVVSDYQLRSQLLEGMKKDLNAWFPNWDFKAYWIAPYFHFEEPKRTMERVGKYRPGNKVPGIEGLYLAGDCYASRAVPGLECASESAMMCVKEILENFP